MITRLLSAVLLLALVSNNDAFAPLQPVQRKISIQSASSSSSSSISSIKSSSSILFSTAQENDQSTTAAATSTTIPIVLNGQNIDLTTALVDYVNKRIGGILKKLATSNSVRECDVVLSVNKNPKVKDAHRVEVLMNVKGTTIIVKNTSPDMYTSIDAAASALSRKLAQYKERRVAGYHGGANMGEDLRTALDAIESMESIDDDDIDTTIAPSIASAAVIAIDEYDDPYKKEVVKINSFQLEKPITVDDAIFALDYVDHDFYVFTNSETGKINVVYKRHTGGIGLVEP